MVFEFHTDNFNYPSVLEEGRILNNIRKSLRKRFLIVFWEERNSRSCNIFLTHILYYKISTCGVCTNLCQADLILKYFGVLLEFAILKDAWKMIKNFMTQFTTNHLLNHSPINYTGMSFHYIFDLFNFFTIFLHRLLTKMLFKMFKRQKGFKWDH